MPFSVSARTIFHLGADLISSDGIAFYELIKNAFDAGSPDVEIEVVVGVPGTKFLDLQRDLADAIRRPPLGARAAAAVAEWRERLGAAVDSTSPNAVSLRRQLAAAGTLPDLAEVLAEANYIEINDVGTGMSLDELEQIYLTIGTSNRAMQKEAQRRAWESSRSNAAGARPVLGEKGVGRLAAMRLGARLQVQTTKSGERYWSTLRIDWADFASDQGAKLEEIDVSPERGELKSQREVQGTRIRVSSLASAWTRARLGVIATTEISKLSDPFVKSRFPVQVAYNGEAIAVPRLERLLFDHAHADCTAEFTADGPGSCLEGTIRYRFRGESRAFRVDGVALLGASAAESFEAFDRLGAFSVSFYWFNRQEMRKLQGLGELKQVVQELQERWAGGLMVYRDGFRVNPYGSGDDDWLNLDPMAFAAAGYKVNRRQLVGKVDISAVRNPTLLDQTNREGLKDNPEKTLLVKLLQHVLLGEFKPFLEQCDKEAKADRPLSVRDIDTRVGREEKRMGQTLKLLKREFPQVERETQVVSTIEDSMGRIKTLMGQARAQVSAYKKTRDRVIHLAATGMLVEILAHELNRATRHALSSLADARNRRAGADMTAAFATLESQLKTLQKRLRILDPIGPAGRQVKESFDLIAWVEEIVRSQRDQFRRHGIEAEVEVSPTRQAGGMKVTMVKGMVVQVLENLLNNSVYWLKQQAKLHPGFEPKIVISVDGRDRTLSVTDNGPGVDPRRREEIFLPYVTTKPAGDGKGLGLFISREIATYHKASLAMANDESIHPGRLNTFVFSLGAAAT